MNSALLLFHLIAFAAYVGGGFAQLQFMKRSERVAPAVRDELESLAALVITKIELPAIFAAILTGGLLIVRTPAYLQQGWLHGKITAVLLLAVLSHLEMFNARAIVRARGANADEAAITARKKRHATLGAVGSVLVAIVLILVTVVRMHGA